MRNRAVTSSAPRKPTAAVLAAAAGKGIRDVVAPGLRVLLVGINPGLYTAATGHHFARPGNRFWPAMFESGFTPRLLSPDEEDLLLSLGYGITNLVQRATIAAAEISKEELIAGARHLEEVVAQYQPEWVAVVGIGA